ncbi:TetR/AcrR family transcriptional regulator [Cytobacillus firmus]|uniref:TetR/AcrR family transcriptional regulator n=1 Tax=Cytobacillus firmus TaxID=1399 RepID=UPI001C8E8415|nr:TetR/AcrR family transcriptional regulator [Cytobacillus firmus]MBX9976101.1 TetR/AcrR family transcriptional regulator [Cytobacillus firmus]
MTEYHDKRIIRSKTAIKETFLKLLSIKSFDHITVSEIVREANYNRGTFYANFETKEHLLDVVIQDALREMIEQIRTPYKSISKVDMNELNIDDITLFTYFQDHVKLYKLLLSNHIRVDFRFQIAKAIEHLFIEEYEYEIEEGASLDTKWLYIYRAHGIAGLIIRWIEEDFSASPEYMAQQTLKLMTTSTKVFYVKNGGDEK